MVTGSKNYAKTENGKGGKIPEKLQNMVSQKSQDMVFQKACEQILQQHPGVTSLRNSVKKDLANNRRSWGQG